MIVLRIILCVLVVACYSLMVAAGMVSRDEEAGVDR